MSRTRACQTHLCVGAGLICMVGIYNCMFVSCCYAACMGSMLPRLLLCSGVAFFSSVIHPAPCRCHAETAARDALGKGFKPEVAPVNNLLARLAARQAALEAR